VTVFNSYPGAGAPIGSNASADYFFRREAVEAFADLALYQNYANTIGEGESPVRVMSTRITPSFFTTLGVEPALGRTFTDEAMDIGRQFEIVLDHGFWQERFAADPGVLGQELRVDGTDYTIVGVMPADFRFGDRETSFYLPIPLSEQERGLENLHSNSYEMIARLAPGSSVEQATEQIEALNASLTAQSPIPDAARLLADTGFHTEVHPRQDFLVRDIAPSLYMLWAGVLLVLLIGCVNIANLQLARARARLAEVATRFAIGASRARLTRQLLSESVLLAVAGGGLGLGVAALGLKLLEVLGAQQLPRGTDIGLDTTVLLFTLILAVGSGVIFGAIPLFSLFRMDLSTVFRQESRTATAGRRTLLLRDALAVVQVAVAFALLVGASLLFTSFRRMLEVEPGFEPENVLTGMVMLPEARYPDGASLRSFTTRLLDEVRSIPGVEAATVTDMLPFGGNNNSSVIFPVGHEFAEGESILSPFRTRVTSGYFETLGIPILQGRGIEATDTGSSERIVVIDEWLARRYWPEESPVGKLMLRGAPGMEEDPSLIHRVVGVVGQIQQNSLSETEHSGAYYLPMMQGIGRFHRLAVRTRVEPVSLTRPIQAAIVRIDPDLPFSGVQTMTGMIEGSMQARRATMLLLIVFAGVALFLAAVGIYGVLAYVVSQRTRELGIMLALGSGTQRVFGLVLRQGLIVLGIGLMVGLGLTLGILAGLVRTLLFGVQPLEPAVYVIVIAILGAIAILAAFFPARRATRIDPVSTLKYD